MTDLTTKALTDLPGWSEPVTLAEARRAMGRISEGIETMCVPPQASDDDMVLTRYMEQAEGMRVALKAWGAWARSEDPDGELFDRAHKLMPEWVWP